MWWRGLVLAGCYCALGQLSLLMAIPPGYAAAFWPAAGVAVAALLLWGNRLWPAIVIGSFLVNVATQFDTTSVAHFLASVALPLGIGAGAALQALLGAALVRRWVGIPDPLNREQKVLGLLFLAGPLSCLVAASVGTLLLLFTQRIAPEQAWFTWWVWLVGDSIGVFVVTPVVLLWAGNREPDWPRRPLTVTVPLLVLACLAVGLFFLSDDRETVRLKSAFEFRTEILTRALDNRIEHVIQVWHRLHNDYGGLPDRDQQQRFVRAAEEMLKTRSAIQKVLWAPRTTAAQRASLEAAGKTFFAPTFTIRDRADAGLTVAAKRADYFPVLYGHPDADAAPLHGLDLAADPSYRDLLMRAGATAEPTASAPVAAPSNHGPGDVAVLVALPVYQGKGPAGDAAERRQAILGFIVGSIDLPILMRNAWRGFDRNGIDVWLMDETHGADKTVVFLSGRDPVVATKFVGGTESAPAAPGVQRDVPLETMERRWKLRFAQTSEFLAAHRSLQPWALLGGGMLSTGLLGAMLLVITGRAALVSTLVDERTAELARANVELTQEVTDRQRAEQALRQSEERFRLLVEGTTDYAIFMLDTEGNVTSWNAGAERITGYLGTQIIGQPFTRFFTEEDIRQNKPQQILELAAQTGRSEGEGWRIRKDGSRFWVNAILTRVRSSDGRLQGYWKILRDLTERKRTEEKFRGLLESAPDAFVIVNESGVITLVNRRTELMFGYERSDLIGQPVEKLLPARYREAHVGHRTSFFAHATARPMGKSLNLFALRKDWAEFPVEISLSPLVTDEGMLVSAAVRDISERKRNEEALRTSEERFRALTQSMNDAVISADSLGQIIFWNRSAERIFGYREEEAIGQPLTVLFPPHSQWAGNGDLQSLITGESPLVGNLMEMQARRKDGSDFPLELSLASWQTHGGRFISAVLRDITRRKQAENALEESRHFIQRVAEMMPNILYVYDVKKECNIFINRGLESILGHAWEEGAGLSMPAITEEIHAEDLARVAWANEQCQSAKDGAVIEVEYRVRHADGSWRWLHCRNTIFVRNLDGNPEQILGTAEDITERKRLEQEVLEIAASEQRRIGQELHDGTGQELTGLAMLAANLADSLTNTRPEDAQLSRRIAQGVSHALTHVRALSRGLIPVEVDAEGLMSALSDLTQRIADLHRLQCDFECVEPVPIEDNHTATQLYRIAQEAITNALKHGQPTRIRVSLEMRGHYVTLRIADDGVGIPTDELKVGTGLRIMRYRAGQIGAHLSVRPGPVRGTVVACTLFCGDQS